MKTLFNVVKVLSVAALVSSCAYENDPGLAPPAPAKPAVNDPYAKMQSAELLQAKYKTLSAECSITASLPEDVSGQQADAATPPPAAPPSTPPKPVDEQGAKTVLNFIDQQKVDADLSKDMATQLILEIKPSESEPVESTVIVKLTLKPVKFEKDVTKKEGTKVYVMKHSPKLVAAATFTMAGKNAVELDPADIEISENVAFSKVLARTGSDREKRTHTLSCLLKGDVTDKPEAQGQWLMVDCAAAAPGDDKPAEKAAFALNCKKQEGAPPAAQPPAK